jgi:hypothetical protein
LDIQIIISLRLAELELLDRALETHLAVQTEVRDENATSAFERERASQDVKLTYEILQRLRDRDAGP